MTTPPNDGSQLPTLTRKERRAILEERRRRRNRRRRARLRRLQVMKSLRSIQFWLRVLGFAVIGLCIVFWARFAFVYDIPSFAAVGLPPHVQAYVAVKPWWFGPPVFDIGNYDGIDNWQWVANPYQYLIYHMGRYASILSHPHFVWIRAS
ncbi:hypothetical protein [Alicyclobacillus acidiphilus]|uniref:hypothetical protein n=1 Tax=Alicyclobacillus acidiphilus TaxID=182455 RepID=UPI0008342E95|nr:hypothetical protein [Alicyclobacillus acidiphilus]